MKLQKHTLVLIAQIIATNAISLVAFFIAKPNLDEAIKGLRGQGFVIADFVPFSPIILASIVVYLALLIYINRKSVTALRIYTVFMAIAAVSFVMQISQLTGLVSTVKSASRITLPIIENIEKGANILSIAYVPIIIIVAIAGVYTFRLSRKFAKEKKAV